jgi:hypothetical protein
MMVNHLLVGIAVMAVWLLAPLPLRSGRWKPGRDGLPDTA